MTEQLAQMGKDPMIRKIQALLDKADSSEFGPERDAFREKADQLIVKYAIESYEMDEARAAKGEVRLQTPIQQDLLIPTMKGDGLSANWKLVQNIACAVGCRLIYRGFATDDNNVICYKLTIIGFATDVHYVELLYFSLRLQMLTMLFPKPDPSQSFDQNVYTLHEAGLKWENIKDLMNHCRAEMGASVKGKPIWREIAWDDKNHDGGSLRSAAKRWAKATGDTYHSVANSENYRISFADAFVERIYRRLTATRQDSGKELVLARRQEDVTEMWESLLPKPTEEELANQARRRVAKVKTRAYDYEAARRGRDAADRAVISRPGSGVHGNSVSELGS